MNSRQSTSGVSLKWQPDGSLTSSFSQNLDDTINAMTYNVDSEVVCYPNEPRLPSATVSDRLDEDACIKVETISSTKNVQQPSSATSMESPRESHRYVKVVKEHREREAKMMQDLNQRLATHIEKVRFFECQNRRLAEEMELLKRKWNERTLSNNNMCEAQLQDVKRRLDESERERSKLDVNIASVSRQLEAAKLRFREISDLYETEKKKYGQKEARLYDIEAGIKRLSAQLEETETERNKLKTDNVNLRDANMRLKNDLDSESLKRKEADRKVKLSGEQLEALKQAHEQEMGTISGLAFKDSTADNRAMWQSEMGQALQDIQKTYEEKMSAVHTEYDERLAVMQAELGARYKVQLESYQRSTDQQNKDVGQLKRDLKKFKLMEAQMGVKLGERDAELAHLRNQLDTQTREFERRAKECDSENKCLRSKVKRLNAELDATLAELEGLLHSNPYLDMEISAYRTLLDRGERETATACGPLHSSHIVVAKHSSNHSSHSSKGQRRH